MRAMSASGACAPILTLKVRCRRASSLRSRLLHLLRRVAGGERPQHRDAVSHRSAEQRGRRKPKRLADRIEQRRFNRGLGGVVALGGLVHADAGRLEPVSALAHDRGGEIGVDVGLHGLDALLAPARATERRGLTDALSPVGKPHPHEDVVLRRDRGGRQLVLAHRRHVDDGARHLPDDQVAAQVRCDGTEGVGHGRLGVAAGRPLWRPFSGHSAATRVCCAGVRRISKSATYFTSDPCGAGLKSTIRLSLTANTESFSRYWLSRSKIWVTSS